MAWEWGEVNLKEGENGVGRSRVKKKRGKPSQKEKRRKLRKEKKRGTE